MRRRLFNALCLLSLVLAVAVAALWARSVWWASDQVWIALDGQTGIVARSAFGNVLVSYEDLWDKYRGRSLGPYGHESNDAGGWLIELPSFQGPLVYNQAHAILPCWFLLSMISLMPIFWVVRNARGRKPTFGSCPRCGYDLRGSSGGGPECPECGAAVVAPPAEAPGRCY